MAITWKPEFILDSHTRKIMVYGFHFKAGFASNKTSQGALGQETL